MPNRTRALVEAAQRAQAVRVEIGREVRQARLAGGYRLETVGRAVNRSASWVSRVERGKLTGVRVDDLVMLSAAVGLRLWIRTFPDGRAVRDAAQLQLLRRFRARVGEAWQWRLEVPVPIPGDLRAADAVIVRGPQVCMVWRRSRGWRTCRLSCAPSSSRHATWRSLG